MRRVKLSKNFRAKSGYLWIFSNEIEDRLSNYQKGEIVTIQKNDGTFYAIGYINPNSLIAIRILSFNQITINEAFFEERIKRAILYRKNIGYFNFDACRLIYSESDFLPGLIVDRYKDCLVVQILTAGMEALYPLIKEILISLLAPKAIVLKNDSPFRELEGLERFSKLDYGNLEDEIVILEDEVKFLVDPIEGQKSGFFLDQRENRVLLKRLLTHKEAKRVLDCFSYSGGWALQASAYKKSEVQCVDISKKATELILKNSALNEKKIEVVCKDAFVYLRELVKQKEQFDCIILDPPAFIKSKSKIKDGLRGYKEINLQAMKLLNKGGLLVTASCSHHLNKPTFLELLKTCAKESKKSIRIISDGNIAFDHPILLSMPETEYLKCFFLECY